jgi:hypothetical protein
MSYNDYEDFYELFEQHPTQFAESTTYEEFCKLVGKDYLAKYIWAGRVFATAKAGKRTYRPLVFPQVNTFAELFEKAELLPTETTDSRHGKAKFLSGSASVCMHVGGKRSWSERTLGTRAHYGAKFYGTYVTPTPMVADVKMTLAPCPQGFEAIAREDGILVIATDGLCIGSDWLALLPLTENIETLFDTETKELLARERQAEIDAWGPINAL